MPSAANSIRTNTCPTCKTCFVRKKRSSIDKPTRKQNKSQLSWPCLLAICDFFHVGACYLLNGLMAGSWFYVCQTTKHWNLMTWKKHALFNVILDQHWYHLILMNVKMLFKLITNLKRVRCLFPYSQHRVWLPKQSHTHTHISHILFMNKLNPDIISQGLAILSCSPQCSVAL